MDTRAESVRGSCISCIGTFIWIITPVAWAGPWRKVCTQMEWEKMEINSECNTGEDVCGEPSAPPQVYSQSGTNQSQICPNEPHWLWPIGKQTIHLARIGILMVRPAAEFASSQKRNRTIALLCWARGWEQPLGDHTWRRPILYRGTQDLQS